MLPDPVIRRHGGEGTPEDAQGIAERYVQPGDRVRDFGCGPGIFTRECAYDPDAVFDAGFIG
jgi:hypothetical protein